MNWEPEPALFFLFCLGGGGEKLIRKVPKAPRHIKSPH